MEAASVVYIDHRDTLALIARYYSCSDTETNREARFIVPLFKCGMCFNIYKIAVWRLDFWRWWIKVTLSHLLLVYKWLPPTDSGKFCLWHPLTQYIFHLRKNTNLLGKILILNHWVQIDTHTVLLYVSIQANYRQPVFRLGGIVRKIKFLC